MKIEKIAIIGLGLIGGSLAKTIKKNTDIVIVGIDKSADVLKKSEAEKVIDFGSESIEGALDGCDLVFLCTDIKENEKLLEEVVSNAPESAFITDVGSVKRGVFEQVKRLGVESRFIGGHPMAGAEKSGYDFSSDVMFENAYYIVTPGEEVSEKDLDSFNRLLKNLHAIPLVMTPERHDYATAMVSHVPHIVAYLLTNLLNHHDDDDHTFATIAAGGFRDMTRIASSSPDMWVKICRENKKNVIYAIDWILKALGTARINLEEGDYDMVKGYFELAKSYHDEMIGSGKAGAIDSAHELYVDINDEAGAIATVATMLGEAGISIKNIGIIHNRESDEGILRVEFYDEAALEDAKRILSENEFTIHVR